MIIKSKKKKRPTHIRDRKAERLRFKVLTSQFNKVRGDLGDKIQQQADELKVKNGQLRSGEEKQVKSEEQIHIRTKAMESTSDGIFIIDAQKTDLPVVYANRSFQKMTGYSKTEITGRNYFLIFGSGADSHIIDEIKDAMRQGRPFHGEMLNFRKNGEKFWSSLRIAPVRDPYGLVTHCVGIQTDITLMREKELEIDEQREDLLHVTRVGKLAEFVSSLAHEISQPLTAILSYAQTAQRMLVGKEPKIREILQYIIDDNQRATGVIRRLRMLLKKSEPEILPLNINDLIHDTVVLIATDAIVRSIVLKLDLADALPLIRGDRILLQQVLLNLISNGFDAMERNVDPREISIGTSRQDTGSVLVEIRDSGCGIPVNDMPKLFTHFFTSKPDGLGMGLSISRSIVEAHGGRLDGRNNPGRGATFSFGIPFETKGT